MARCDGCGREIMDFWLKLSGCEEKWKICCGNCLAVA